LAVVVDTHAWVWWLDTNTKLSRNAAEAIASADRLGVPAITCWEVALNVRLGRLALSQDLAVWLGDAVDDPLTEVLPLTPEIARRAADLSDFQRDPADRLIVATAMEYGWPLVTADQRIRRYVHVETIW
jgi:PIN domain nuclease of toxin-antitoxin system